MYEIRKAGNTYRIYDKENKAYVGYTREKDTAETMVYDYLKNRGFEGEIPAFILRGMKYGINLDNINSDS